MSITYYNAPIVRGDCVFAVAVQPEHAQRAEAIQEMKVALMAAASPRRIGPVVVDDVTHRGKPALKVSALRRAA